MTINTHKLSDAHQSLLVPFLRKTHTFTSDEEALQTALHELTTSREMRGAFVGEQLHGIVSWEERGAPKHGVVEVVRFSLLEPPFSPAVAEMLLDTALASIDYFFHSHHSKFRKLFMTIDPHRKKATRFLEDRGFMREAELARHYHDNRNEVLYSLFR